MPTKPCVVCEYPVPVEPTASRMLVFKDGDHPDPTTSIIAVCGSRRCQRMVAKAIKEEKRFKLVK